jgi:hypothetical protein
VLYQVIDADGTVCLTGQAVLSCRSAIADIAVASGTDPNGGCATTSRSTASRSVCSPFAEYGAVQLARSLEESQKSVAGRILRSTLWRCWWWRCCPRCSAGSSPVR